MEIRPKVLICDDDSAFHLAVKHSLKGKYDCRSAYHGDEALAILKNHPIDILLLDVQMRTPDEGLKYIPRMKELDPEISIVMSSGKTDFQTVREAMRLGAVDYIPKDFDPNELTLTLNRVLERKHLLQRKDQQSFEVASHQKQQVLVGNSPQMQSLRKVLEKIRNSQASVVITGETGTGKEVVARHLRRTLPDGSLEPFIAVDSATIQSSLAESVLFGHEKGAFTGAEKASKGIFEEAHHGIVYFDEIGNMPLSIQAKLLRVLQEKEVVRLGSARAIQLEFRVVCATNKNLEEMVKEGNFKDDLLQRLNVLPIHLSPLRERATDIPLLVEHFVQKTRREIKFSPEALEVLMAYSWPGNIRELSNLVAYVIAMTEGSVVEESDLPPKIRDAARSASATKKTLEATEGENFYKQVAGFESEILKKEYERLGGNISRMALTLGMDRSHLYTKLKEYKIHAARKD